MTARAARPEPMPRNSALVLAPTPFFADRGCHVRIYEETRLLQDLGWYVEVVTYHNGRDMPEVFTRRTPSFPWYRKLGPGPSYHKLYIDLLLLFRCIRVIREIRPRIIHAHLHEGAFLGVLLGRMFGIPCVADLQGSLTKELADYRFAGRNRIVYRVLKAVEGWVDRHSDHLIVSSDAMIEDLQERFGVPAERITLVKDGVGRGFFEPVTAASVPPTLRALRRHDGDRVVVFLGVLTRLQGIEILMEAIPRVLDRTDDVTFLVIGFPEHESFARRLAKEGYRERVVFTGRMPYLEVSQALSLADLALSPKISETEGNGKLFNYMAAGLPTIVFDNVVNREILGDAGIYVADRTPEALATAILAALADPEDGARRGGELRRRARERSDWALNRQPLTEIYRNLARPAEAPAGPSPSGPPQGGETT